MHIYIHIYIYIYIYVILFLCRFFIIVIKLCKPLSKHYIYVYIYTYICVYVVRVIINLYIYYIGESCENFRYIFNIHTHSIRQKKLLPLPLYFNADGHNINDLKVCILKGNLKDTKHRKLTELQFIINFETNKFGFNKYNFFHSKHTFLH